MKKFAFYLPQFHCIPENDEWWGEGFTEWTNVKRAKPLYQGHLQPKVPKDGYYYNLLDKDTLSWQSSLLHKYGVDGLIFYHYYFEGKMLLEKPAELLLKSKDIPIRFFFCWANHSWYRSWEGNKKLLIEQRYGEEEEWEKHFEYLLPFFKDERYEKRDNKPLFMIFKSDFDEKNRMLQYFDKRCRENGFAGLCAIETRESYNVDDIRRFEEQKSICTEFIHLREPSSSFLTLNHSKKFFLSRVKKAIGKAANRYFKVRYVRRYRGDELYDEMTKFTTEYNNIIRGLFFEWDNTPRHGYRGYIISAPEHDKFIRYMNSVSKDEFLFINAWNEWAEGMMIEPTEENGYKYLEWLKDGEK